MPKLWPWYFYPRPPRGGRHIPYLYRYIIVSISIHALREEGDPVKVSANTALILISIHALREEGDLRRRNQNTGSDDFYPRPPRGGRQA